MTDLTEQWKKGELDLDHSYYLKLKDGSLLKCQAIKNTQALLSDQLAKKEGVEINAELKAENERLKTFLKKAINLVMESNWENHAHYKESIQLRDETNNLLNDSPSPTDLKQG